MIKNGPKKQQKIARLVASGYNSAAFDKNGRIWMWGGVSRGKLGLGQAVRDQLEPINVEFEVVHKDKNEPEIQLEPFLDDNKSHRKINTEYITEFENISWGMDHCLFLDKKHRVFSMGFGRHGRLGQGDEKDLLKPKMVRTLEGKKVIDVQCGLHHSMAVTD